MKYLVVDAVVSSDVTVLEGKRPWIFISPEPLTIGGLYCLCGGRHSRVKLCRVIREITQPF